MSKHLMARFRHLRTADGDGLRFDWRPSDLWTDASKAQLENGDWLHVKPHHGRWEYSLYGPTRPERPFDPHPDLAYFSGVDGRPGFAAMRLGDRKGVHALGSLEEAQRAAEEHYLGLNRKGATPSATHDYDINDVMRRFKDGDL